MPILREKTIIRITMLFTKFTDITKIYHTHGMTISSFFQSSNFLPVPGYRIPLKNIVKVDRIFSIAGTYAVGPSCNTIYGFFLQFHNTLLPNIPDTISLLYKVAARSSPLREGREPP